MSNKIYYYFFQLVCIQNCTLCACELRCAYLKLIYATHIYNTATFSVVENEHFEDYNLQGFRFV